MSSGRTLPEHPSEECGLERLEGWKSELGTLRLSPYEAEGSSGAAKPFLSSGSKLFGCRPILRSYHACVSEVSFLEQEPSTVHHFACNQDGASVEGSCAAALRLDLLATTSSFSDQECISITLPRLSSDVVSGSAAPSWTTITSACMTRTHGLKIDKAKDPSAKTVDLSLSGEILKPLAYDPNHSHVSRCRTW